MTDNQHHQADEVALPPGYTGGGFDAYTDAEKHKIWFAILD